jgi:hypothetical protein
MPADLLANVERAERPVRIPPLVPDLESTAPHWLGPAGADTQRWKARALRAEALVERLMGQLARYRMRP